MKPTKRVSSRSYDPSGYAHVQKAREFAEGGRLFPRRDGYIGTTLAEAGEIEGYLNSGNPFHSEETGRSLGSTLSKGTPTGPETGRIGEEFLPRTAPGKIGSEFENYMKKPIKKATGG